MKFPLDFCWIPYVHQSEIQNKKFSSCANFALQLEALSVSFFESLKPHHFELRNVRNSIQNPQNPPKKIARKSIPSTAASRGFEERVWPFFLVVFRLRAFSIQSPMTASSCSNLNNVLAKQIHPDNTAAVPAFIV
jgi:hypothetical protein